jgi:hypothetical protein
MNGWYQVDCRELGTKRRRTFTLDELVKFADTKKKTPATRSKRKPLKTRRK